MPKLLSPYLSPCAQYVLTIMQTGGELPLSTCRLSVADIQGDGTSEFAKTDNKLVEIAKVVAKNCPHVQRCIRATKLRSK